MLGVLSRHVRPDDAAAAGRGAERRPRRAARVPGRRVRRRSPHRSTTGRPWARSPRSPCRPTPTGARCRWSTTACCGPSPWPTSTRRRCSSPRSSRPGGRPTRTARRCGTGRADRREPARRGRHRRDARRIGSGRGAPPGRPRARAAERHVGAARRQGPGARGPDLRRGRVGAALHADDVAFAEDLARRAALAIDNADLYSQTRRVASVLQATLLPQDMPEVEGWQLGTVYRQAGRTDVGGDYYDVSALDDGRVSAVVGDVMGRGCRMPPSPDRGCALPPGCSRPRTPSPRRWPGHGPPHGGGAADPDGVRRLPALRARARTTSPIVVAGHPPPLLAGRAVAVRHRGRLPGARPRRRAPALGPGALRPRRPAPRLHGRARRATRREHRRRAGTAAGGRRAAAHRRRRTTPTSTRCSPSSSRP